MKWIGITKYHVPFMSHLALVRVGPWANWVQAHLVHGPLGSWAISNGLTNEFGYTWKSSLWWITESQKAAAIFLYSNESWLPRSRDLGYLGEFRVLASSVDQNQYRLGKSCRPSWGDKLNIMCEFQISHRHIGPYSNIPGEGLWLNMFILFLTQWFWCVNSIALWLHNNKPEPTCPIERSEFKVYPSSCCSGLLTTQ